MRRLKHRLKEGISIQQLEDFAKKHTAEVFSSLAIFCASVSSIFGFFSGPGMALLFAAIGTLVAIIFPVLIEAKLKTFYHFVSSQEKSTEMILGGVKIVVAIFLPFLFFCFLGLLAGSSYHYYLLNAKIEEKNR